MVLAGLQDLLLVMLNDNLTSDLRNKSPQTLHLRVFTMSTTFLRNACSRANVDGSLCAALLHHLSADCRCVAARSS